MSAAAETAEATEGAEASPPRLRSMRKRTLLVAAPLLLATITGGFWASGILPGLLGLGGAGTGPVVVPRPVPGFVELPEIVSNLNAPGRRAAFVRLRAKLEISDASQAPAVQAAMPRLIDLFATYLREVRPEELRGSAGTHRLREELIARAGLAVAGPVRGEAPPVRVTDVLFLEILIQ